MARRVPEWIGKDDDTQVPPRVRLRIFMRFNGTCSVCGTRIIGKRWVLDHHDAIINGGGNREGNLVPVHESCHKPKTADDLVIKSKNYRVAAKHAGIRTKSGRRMPFGKDSPFKKKISGEIIKRKE